MNSSGGGINVSIELTTEELKTLKGILVEQVEWSFVRKNRSLNVGARSA